MASSEHPSPEDLLTQALRAEAEDRLVDALRAFRAVLDINPRSEKALLGVGRISLLFEKYEEALIDFTAVLLRNPQCAEAFRGRGLCYFNTGLPEKALSDLAQAIKLSPGEVEPLLSMGQIALELELFDVAEEALRAALEQDAADPDIALELARCLLLREHDNDAEVEGLLATVAGSLGAGDPFLLLLYAELHARRGQHGQARRLLAQALQNEPELADDAFLLPHLSEMILAEN